MLVSHTHKFVFVHVYKTGGTSIRRALESVCDELPENLNGHATAAEMRRYFHRHQPQVNHYFWFAVVRNPFELLVSLWKFVSSNPRHPDHRIVEQQSFTQFVRWLSETGWSRVPIDDDRILKPEVNVPRYITLSDFLCDSSGGLLVDEVMRQECLGQQWDNLMARLGLDVRLDHLNASDHAHFRSYYDDKSRALLERHHQQDLQRFDYAFDD